MAKLQLLFIAFVLANKNAFVLANKSWISLRCVAPHGFCQNTLLSCEHSFCPCEQKVNFFTVRFTYLNRKPQLYGALHLTDSKRHNVAIRFLIFVLSNKVVISLRCVAPHGFGQNTLFSLRTFLLSLQTKAQFLYGALHLSESQATTFRCVAPIVSHNVALRFLIFVLSNKVPISLRCVAPIWIASHNVAMRFLSIWSKSMLHGDEILKHLTKGQCVVFWCVAPFGFIKPQRADIEKQPLPTDVQRGCAKVW